MQILVFGAGAVGSLIGGLLARTHAVTLVGRDPHMRVCEANGLDIRGEITEHQTLSGTTTQTGHEADIALITVKTFDTMDACTALNSCEIDTVCSLQNGLTESTLATELNAPVVAGTCRYGALQPRPGVVKYTGQGKTVFGGYTERAGEAAECVHRAFREAGIHSSIADDIRTQQWEKLAINAGMNATTALARVKNGVLVNGTGNELAQAVTAEAVTVAQAVGVDLSLSDVRHELDTTITQTAANRSSMLVDVSNDGPTEVDAINGAIVQHAAEHDIDAPRNETLWRLLTLWERNHH
ncbi:MAG: ketopantoate reductase [Haloquadratum sp. J07HQX50]|nr:MAG: ketopantoate reductase [Haloquadratum sp. J07HQX50]